MSQVYPRFPPAQRYNATMTLSFRRRILIPAAALTALVGAFALAQATKPAAAPAARDAKQFHADEFLRYVDDDVRPRLEVSIFTLKGADGFTVDLVSAVHIADESFYQDLNHRFEGYDAVLYEMVKPKDAAAPVKGHKSGSAVSGLQRGMKTMLGLTFQLDEVDYQKDNFVHADLDVDAFFKRQEERGESLMGLMMKAYMQQLTGAEPPPSSTSTKPVKYKPITFGNTVESRQYALKVVLGGMFGDLERQSLGLDGPDGSAILTDRNDAAIEVIRRVRKEGKKRIAVFYGAAHMPDMATQLVVHDGLKPTATDWLTAWDLTPPKASPATQPK